VPRYSAAVQTLLRWAIVFLGVTGCRTDSNGNDEKPASEAAETAPPTPSPTDAPEQPPAPWARGLPAALAAGIVPPQTDDATYRVDPFVAALIFEELQALGGGSTLQKFTSDGKDGKPASGYRLEGIVEDSLFHRLGLRNGDVIESLNGVLLTSPDRVGFALDGAENAVTLGVYRDAMSFTIAYRFSGGLAWRNLLAEFTGSADPGAGVDAPIVADASEVAEGGAAPTPEPDDSPAGGAGGEPAVDPDPDPDPSPSPSPSGGSSKPSPSGGSSKLPKPSTPSRPSTPSKPSTPTNKNVSCESSSRCTIEKDLFDDMVASPQRLSRDAKVVPAIRDDVHSGYKLSYVKPGSSVAQLGFRSGDKITHVNGRDLTDDIQAMSLYMSLSSTRVFKIRYERGTQKLVKTVTVV
jgi:type II secretory pathway component PulC